MTTATAAMAINNNEVVTNMPAMRIQNASAKGFPLMSMGRASVSR